MPPTLAPRQRFEQQIAVLVEKFNRQRERLLVDVAFLDDVTAWREKLAKAVFKIEPEIGPEDLNGVVQVFLDRLIFIRFAEDYGILAKRGLIA